MTEYLLPDPRQVDEPGTTDPRYADPRYAGPAMTEGHFPFRDRAGSWLARNILGDTREGHATARKGTNLLDFTPGFGDVSIGSDAYDALDQGKYLEGGLLTGLGLLGAVPLLGGGIRPIGRKVIQGMVAPRPSPESVRAATKALAPATEAAPTAIIQVPDLRSMSFGDAAKQARTEHHLIQSKDGQFVGAPRGMTTKEGVAKMRADLDQEVADGAAGADWYALSRSFIVRSQRTKAQQSLAAHEYGFWSPQTTPDPNTNWAIHADLGYESKGTPGLPDILHTGRQSRDYKKARDAAAARGGWKVEDALPQGPKTGVFAQHLDPNRPFATTGTNDIWHARALGYKGVGNKAFDRTPTPQEHRFMDYETVLAVERANAKKLGGRTDWTPERLQAAAWVSAKGKTIAKDKGVSVAEGVELASKSYPDFAPKYTASVPSEQVPGDATGLLSGLHTASTPTKRAFSLEAPWAAQGGQDPLLRDVFGGRYLLPSLRGTGAFRNRAGLLETNPMELGRQMVPFESSGTARHIPQDVAEGLNATQAIRGLLDMQEGSAWNKVITHSTGPKTAFNLTTRTMRSPTEAQMRRAVEIAEKHDIAIIANADGGLAFNKVVDTKGMSVADAAKAEKTAASDVNSLLKGDLGNELRQVFKGATFERGIWQGGYIDLSYQLALKHAGKGYATKKIIRQLNKLKSKAPGFYDNLINSKGVQIKARKNLERYNNWIGKVPGAQRDDYVKLLDIVGTSKIKGLLDYVKKYGSGGLPAIALVALSPHLRGESAGNKPGGSEERI